MILLVWVLLGLGLYLIREGSSTHEVWAGLLGGYFNVYVIFGWPILLIVELMVYFTSFSQKELN
jgi:hypothetical protein